MAKVQSRVAGHFWGGPSNAAGGGSTGGGPAVGAGSSKELASSSQPSNAERTSGSGNWSFAYLNLAASQTALRATRDIGGTQSQIAVQAPYPGSIIGLAYRSNAAKTAGTASFTVYVAETATAATTAWTTNNSGAVQTFTPGTYVFSANDVIDVRVITDSSFAPTTADVEVILYVSFQS